MMNNIFSFKCTTSLLYPRIVLFGRLRHPDHFHINLFTENFSTSLPDNVVKMKP